MKTNTLVIKEMEISYKPSKKVYDREEIVGSAAAHHVIKKLYNQKTLSCQEEFIVLYMNNANIPIGYYRASKGGLTSTTADVRLILSVALKCMATAIIISHNHPSGNLRPSTADKVITIKISQACKFLEISLLDHIIVTPHSGYYSFSDHGKL